MKNMNMRKVIFSMLAITAAIIFMSNSSCSKKKREEQSRQAYQDSMSIVRLMDSIVAAEAAKAAIEQAMADSIAAVEAMRADSIAADEAARGVVTGALKEDGYVMATVVDKRGLDGCMYMLKLEDGKMLQPLNLPKAYQKEGTKVWIKYKAQKDAMSVCMAGDVVTIMAIEEG